MVFRKLAQTVSAVLRKTPAKGPTVDVGPAMHHEGASAKSQAYNELRDAIRELSNNSTASPISPPSEEDFTSWISKPISELSTTQLEDLARACFDGAHGVAGNVPKAVELWLEGFKRGSVQSSYSLAACLRGGKGIAKDPSRAFEIFEQLAREHDYNLAHYSLGMMLAAGEGVKVDEKRAFESFMAAAKGGVLPALYNIGNCYSGGKGVAKSDHNALLYYEAAAKAGDPAALFTLGTWHFQGREVTKDVNKAFSLQLQAAEAGHPGAMFNVGAHFMAGSGTEKNYAKAASWFEKAAKRGIVQAEMNLGNMHRLGLGVPKNLTLARQILSKYMNVSEDCKEAIKAIDEEINNTGKT